MISRPALSDLFQAVKRGRGRCLEKGAAVEQAMAQHPTEAKEALRAAALAVDRAPFPSVDGNPPMFRDLSYFDARFWYKEWGLTPSPD